MPRPHPVFIKMVMEQEQRKKQELANHFANAGPVKPNSQENVPPKMPVAQPQAAKPKAPAPQVDQPLIDRMQALLIADKKEDEDVVGSSSQNTFLTALQHQKAQLKPVVQPPKPMPDRNRSRGVADVEKSKPTRLK